MKGICMSIGLLAATAVAGQQKETADLNKLIRQRIDSSMQQQWSLSLFNSPVPPAIRPLSKDLKGQLEYILPNGDLVYRLPTDQMPCIKPGNQLVYTMPVIPFKKELIQPDKAGSIPNPGL